MSVDLKKYVNPENIKGEFVHELIVSEEDQLESLKANVTSSLNETFIRKASDIGLRILESEYGLKYDNTLSLEERRERLIAHKRGQGTTTIEMIKNVALAFSCGDIDVIEHYTDYYVTIKFISTIGVPKNMDNFKENIRKIMPAHLGIEYEFTYNTEGDIEDAGWTEEELEQFTEEEIMTSQNIKTHTMKESE